MSHRNCLITLTHNRTERLMEVSKNPSKFSESGAAPAERGRWLRPAVSRLAAGSAEDGNNNHADGGQPS
jgi:hypothetical protein